VNALIATVLIVAVSVWAFLRFVPVGAEALRLRRFNRRALGYLAVLCAVFVGAIALRASSPQFSLEASQIFLLIFVPQYLIFAGLFRSRALSSFHRGGKSTV
jgi:cation transport ATPase